MFLGFWGSGDVLWVFFFSFGVVFFFLTLTFSTAVPSLLHTQFAWQREVAMAKLWPQFSNPFKNTHKYKNTGLDLGLHRDRGVKLPTNTHTL